MYRCEECNSIFETPTYESEYVGQDNQCGLITYSECPHCGSGRIDTLYCDNCNKEIKNTIECYEDGKGHYYCSEECLEVGDEDEA